MMSPDAGEAKTCQACPFPHLFTSLLSQVTALEQDNECMPAATASMRLAPSASPELLFGGWCFTMRALRAMVVAGATYDEVRLFAELLFQGNCSIVGKLLQVWPHIKPGQRTRFERGWVCEAVNHRRHSRV